jgi:hypothetical protein
MCASTIGYWLLRNSDIITLNPQNNLVCLRFTISGHYMYIEGSEGPLGGYDKTAVLVSPTLPYHPWGPRFCLHFWYSMKGSTMGSLTVNVTCHSALASGCSSLHTHAVWSRQGHQGNQWQRADVTIDVTNDVTVWSLNVSLFIFDINIIQNNVLNPCLCRLYDL